VTKRNIGYRWRLREVMASNGMFNTTDLTPLLADRGIALSVSQVHRLVTGTPERLSLPVLSALCDIFDVTPADLILTTAENTAAGRRRRPGRRPRRDAARPGADPPRAVSSYDDIAAPDWTGKTRIDLWERLHELLDDGTGHTPPQLQGLLWDLVSMPEPARGLTWLRNNPTAGGYLRGLARGDIPLTHDALHGLPSWRTAAHLRDLLMASGALPHVDRQILLFERWYRNQLQAVSDPGHEQLLRQFVTWHLLPRMRAKAVRRPLTAGSRNAAANKLTVARKFLTWLASQGRQPRQATQADVDTWFATRPQPQALAGFLDWAMTRGHIPRLGVPCHARSRQAPVSQHRRLTLLNRFLTDQRIPLRTRVASCLLLLYAQPVTRLVRLTIHDVIDHESQVSCASAARQPRSPSHSPRCSPSWPLTAPT
jgi:DNA-binding Xre family transcriptional regulator